MSGLTDEQFETVCDLAERVAGEDIFQSLPALLESLLAAARRGLGTDGKPWDEEWRKYLYRTKTEIDADSRRLIDQLKAGLDAHSDLEDAPGPHEDPQVNELGPENGRAIRHWDAQVTEMGCKYIRQSEATGCIHGSYTPEPNKIPPPPPHTHESHKDFDSDGATGGES